MIPSEINSTAISKAIDWVSVNGFPAIRSSKKYDLWHEGECFPPKYIISKAAEFSKFGRFLFHKEFNAVEAKNYLIKLGMDIRVRSLKDNASIIDELITKRRKHSKEDIRKVIRKLSILTPEKSQKLVEVSNRRDTPLVRMIKQLYNFKCQMPGCTSHIVKKDGSLYCEVIHITPYSQTKTSQPGNLTVLCPNHHKEFDLGDLSIIIRKNNKVSGSLNGRKFEFTLKVY